MAVSNVAPPHISRLNRPGISRAVASATFTKSYVRNRVANNDWWASRIVVSVSSSGFCFRTHWQNLSGPSVSSRSRSPLGTGPETVGTTGVGSSRLGSCLPLVSGRPLTITSPR